MQWHRVSTHFRGLGVTINVGPYVYMKDDRVQFWDTTLNGGTGGYRNATNNDPFRWFTATELNSTVVSGFDARASLGDPGYTQVGAETTVDSGRGRMVHSSGKTQGIRIPFLPTSRCIPHTSRGQPLLPL